MDPVVRLFFEFKFFHFNELQIIPSLNIRTINPINGELFGRETCLNEDILFPIREILFCANTVIEMITSLPKTVLHRSLSDHSKSFISNWLDIILIY